MSIKNINLGHVILIGTLLVSIPRFAAAFSQAEPNFAGLNISPVTGLGFGVLVEVGIYYIISTWFSAKRRSLKLAWILVAGFVAQLIIAPIIIAPAIVAHINESSSEISSVLTNNWTLWGWSIITAVAPSLLLATVAAASYMQEPTSHKSQTTSHTRNVAIPATNANANASQGVASATNANADASQNANGKIYMCKFCGAVEMNPHKHSAHVRYCGKNPKNKEQ